MKKSLVYLKSNDEINDFYEVFHIFFLYRKEISGNNNLQNAITKNTFHIKENNFDFSLLDL